MEFANLEAHVLNGFVQIIAEYSEIALHRLNGSREIEVETQSHYYLGLQIYELPFTHILFLFVAEQIDHPRKTGRDRLLKLSRHKY